MAHAIVLVLVIQIGVASQSGAAPVRISGRLAGFDDAPHAGVVVSLRADASIYDRSLAGLEGRAPAPDLATTTTAPDGLFVVEAPTAGFWELVARGENPRIVARRLVVAEEGVELGTWRPTPTRELVIEARDAAGRPVTGARVAAAGESLDSELPDEERRATTDRRGAATVRAASSATVLVVTADGFALASLRVPNATTSEHEAGLPARRLTVRLEPAAPRRVRVLEPDDRAAAGALWLWRQGSIAIAHADGAGMLLVPPVAHGPRNVAFEIWSRSAASHAVPGLSTTSPPSGTGAAKSDDARAAADRVTGGGAAEVPVAAETLPPPLVVRLQPPLVVAGVVRDAETAAPIGGALVFDHEHRSRAIALPDGRFEARFSPPPRRPSLLARAPGHIEGTWSGNASAPSDVLSSPPIEATIELEVAAPIAGVIVDGAGHAVAGAEVSSRHGKSRTSDVGRFRLPPWPRERPLAITVTHPGFAVLGRELSPAELASPEVRLVLGAGRTAIGWVVDAESAPVPDARVALMPFGPRSAWGAGFDHPGRSNTKTDADGLYRLARIAPGDYTVWVECNGYAPAILHGIEVPTGDGAADLGTITLRPGLVAEGIVMTPDRAPITGVQVTVWSRSVVRETTTGDDGRFTIADLPPGDLRLIVEKEGWRGSHAPTTLTLPRSSPLEVVLQRALVLTGRVEDAEGTPIPRATVTAQWLSGGRTSGGTSYEVGPDGVFAFDNLEAGVWDLTASAPGYAPATLRGVTLVAEAEAEPIRLVLGPGAALWGRVTDSRGEPVAGASVEIRIGNARGSITARTDDDGRYRAVGLPLGAASAAASSRSRGGPVRDVVLAPGDNELDLVVDPSRLVVRGHVLEPNGTPARRAEVAASSRGEPRSGGQTDAHGAFEITADPGVTITLSARARGIGGSPEVAVQVGGESVDGVVLQLEPGATVRGRVLGLDLDRLAQVGIQLHPANPVAGYSFDSTVLDYEGRFLIAGIAPGSWEIRLVEGQPFGSPIARTTVELEAGSDVEVTLEADDSGPLVLSGVVSADRQPVAGARVAAFPVDGGRDAGTTTAGDGVFELNGLRPGRHRVEVSHQARVPYTTELELHGDEHLEVELSAANALSGSVVSLENGEPVPWATLSLHRADAGRASSPGSSRADAETRTDAGGAFSFGAVGAGLYILQVDAEGHARHQVELAVGEADVELAVELEPAGGLVLEVVGPGGRLPASVALHAYDAAGRWAMWERYPAGEGGRVTARDVPSGRWRLLVVDGDALAELAITVPAAPVPVRLVPGGYLEVVSPSIEGRRGQSVLELSRPDGRRHLATEDGPLFSLQIGRARVGPLLPGSWTVALRRGDRTVEATANVVAGGVVTVELP